MVIATYSQKKTDSDPRYVTGGAYISVSQDTLTSSDDDTRGTAGRGGSTSSTKGSNGIKIWGQTLGEEDITRTLRITEGDLYVCKLTDSGGSDDDDGIAGDDDDIPEDDLTEGGSAYIQMDCSIWRDCSIGRNLKVNGRADFIGDVSISNLEATTVYGHTMYVDYAGKKNNVGTDIYGLYLRMDDAEKDITDLQSSVATLESNVATLQTTVVSLRNQIDTLNMTIATYASTINSMQQDIDSINYSIQSLSDRLDTIENT